MPRIKLVSRLSTPSQEDHDDDMNKELSRRCETTVRGTKICKGVRFVWMGSYRSHVRGVTISVPRESTGSSDPVFVPRASPAFFATPLSITPLRALCFKRIHPIVRSPFFDCTLPSRSSAVPCLRSKSAAPQLSTFALKPNSKHSKQSMAASR